jgi:hypothetical protein
MTPFEGFFGRKCRQVEDLADGGEVVAVDVELVRYCETSINFTP